MTDRPSDPSQPGCPYHATHFTDCLYCRATPAYEAGRKFWVNQCPYCQSDDIRENEVGGFKWCGACGKNNL